MAGKTPAKAEQSGEVVPPRPYQRFIDMLAQQAELSQSFSDSSDVMADIVDGMLAAESLEDAIAIQDASRPSGKSMVDIEHEVTEIEVVKGDVQYEEHSLGYYLRVTATLMEPFATAGKAYQPGEVIVYATGAPNVVTLLFKAQRQDRFPLGVVIRSKAVANGDLLLLRLIPVRAR
jgi:hypothetical protein